ncbi:nitric oxide synthase-interacting protein [Microdochium nivale]|nr:nitric oxide synthase-interacting protein [Microdochium nivale]
MSHSKRNTSRAVFTSHERDLAKKAWGTNSARLTRESFLGFDACRLCLEAARDPVSCAHGDIFCRECALSNILAQKKEIRRIAKLREAEDRDGQDQRDRQDAEDRERAVREFELTQNGLGANRTGTARRNLEWRGTPLGIQDTPAAKDENGGSTLLKITSASASEAQHRPGKRKFELDEQELLRIAQEDRTKARRAIEDEKSAKTVLPSFWTPSITPTSNTKDALHTIAKRAKTVPMCPAAADDDPHPYSLHGLVTLDFSDEVDDKTRLPVRTCPACKKALTNASRPVLATPCGHVLCRSCVDQFVRPSKHNDHGHHNPHAQIAGGGEGADGVDAAPLLLCYVCDADLTDRGDDVSTVNDGSGKGDKTKKKDRGDKDKIRPGLVDLRCEGTGFSAGGANQVKKSGVQFQC